MLTIIIDAATDISTVILADGEKVISKRSSHGKALKQIHLFIQDTLQEASVRMSDLDKIAVIQGPGSWTGLHVAISTAKTIAQVYNFPLVPISFLDALANSCQRHQGGLVVVNNFPTGNIFFRSYEVSGDKISPLTEHKKLLMSELIEILSEIGRPIKLIGGISSEAVYEIESSGIPNIAIESINYPSDAAMIRLVNEATCVCSDFNDMIFLEPLYMQLASEEPRLFSNKKTIIK